MTTSAGGGAARPSAGGGGANPSSPTAAFVTGGSGFIGGALVRRLRAEGWSVRGLARSDRAAEAIVAAGAEAVRGDLDDVDAIRAGAKDCEIAFHAAAAVGACARRRDFERANVEGTENALRASREAGVRRFVHVSSEAAVLAGEPLIEVDETAPLRPDSRSDYCATKALAEQAVASAAGDGFETVMVRPRMVWGPGDRTLLPGILDAIDRGRFAWVGGGRHRTSTTHVDNAVEGLFLAAVNGRPGGIYFVTDGEPVVFRDFLTELVATEGVEIPDRNVPAWLVRAAAETCESLWRTFGLKGAPPVTRMGYWATALETTIDISRARGELGYEPVRTVADGLEELRGIRANAVMRAVVAGKGR